MKTYEINGVTIDEEDMENLSHSATILFFELPCRQDRDCKLCSFSLLCTKLAELMSYTAELLTDKGENTK